MAIGAGVAIVSAAALAGTGYRMYKYGEKKGTEKVEPILEEEFSKVFPRSSPSDETSGTFKLN